MKFAPINVRPCQILSREGSHHDDGVQKAVARPSGCETSKWIASECAEKILWSRHESVLDGEAVYPDDCTATRKRQIRQKAKKFAVMHILMLKVCSRPHWVKYLHLNL